MADINNKAQIDLTCNGQQVANTLQQLKQRAFDLENALAKAAAAGNKADVKKLERQLRQTNREIKTMTSAAEQADMVLRRLSKASPKELSQTLNTLQKQLKNIDRGSSAWDAQVAKIKAVKAELAAVNAEMRETKTSLDNFNDTINRWQNVVLMAAAALTGIVMAGRKAVESYAEIDSAMADTRKFTGMTADEVQALNEKFKEMNTRTSRQELNLLAQEAGRLGKTSQEDVIGYVRAADILNVALSDLGQGATQTIAKITNIFGDEQIYGTEKALIKVGSVVNVLSQNCTASKPYLTEFAQRLAGVGSQAGMTVPQIMAFGAVLDSQGQKVEMSATALSKLVTDMFKNTSKICKATGMDLQKFSDTLKTSTNDALIMLFEAMNKKGDMSVLSSVFKDMGADGARATQVLATLAGNIETVKQQQETANQAFAEGTSVGHEFEIQNNTVAAGLDKARKRVAELAIELGEKLAPVMKHVISSSSLVLRFLSTLITFVGKHVTMMATLTATIITYTVAVNASTIATKATAAAHAIHNAVVKVGTLIFGTARAAVLLLKAAYLMLKGDIVATMSAQIMLNAVMKTSPVGPLVIGIGILTAVVMKYVTGIKAATKAQDSLNKINREAEGQAAKQMAQINTLIEVAKDESVAMEIRKQAINDLNKIVPEYNAHLDAETGAYKANEEALKAYNDELIRKAKIEGAQKRLAEVGEKIATNFTESYKEEVKRKQAEQDLSAAEANMDKHTKNRSTYAPAQISSQWGINTLASSENTMDMLAVSQASGRLKESREKLKELKDEELELKEEMNILTKLINENGGSVVDEAPVSNPNKGGGENQTKKDALKKLKEEREAEEAAAALSYYKGEQNYEEYQCRLLDIQRQYAAKMLKRTDLTDKEKSEAMAASAEADFKEQSRWTEREKQLFEDDLRDKKAIITQRYADGLIEKEVYNEAMRQLELESMRDMIYLYKEGSEERRKAQIKYDDAVRSDQVKRRQQAEQDERKHQKELDKIRKQAFGNTAADNNAEYAREKALLDEAYNAELAACGDKAKRKLEIEKAYQIALYTLRQQWAKKGSTVAQSELPKSFKTAIESSVEWLNSDGGRALTQSLSTVISGMSDIFSGLSEYMQAELELQTAAIEKKYDAEISAAEGNSYKIKQIEAKKEKELSAAKNKSQKKMYVMQVIQAVAQTAIAALNAYSSAAAIPVVGWIIAPIAAAMATAAGMLQVAALKKQQQASASQGYAEGGFTPKGDKYKAVGVVHAGEWVASQKLLADPVASQMIDTLDYAQRTNTIGSLRSKDVASPAYQSARTASASASSAPIINVQQPTASSARDKKLTSAITRLNERLSEPFVTVNTVTGDYGIEKAQEEYDRLIRNKTPKSRRA